MSCNKFDRFIGITICRVTLLFFILLTIIPSVSAQENYGLSFHSFDFPQEKRTSFEIGGDKPICFEDDMYLSFDFFFIPNRSTYFGYLFRILNKEGQNIDLVYNQKDDIFNTIIGEAFSNINFRIDRQQLYNKWTNIQYHLFRDTLSCYINNKLYKVTRISLKDNCFKIIFGACSDHDFSTTDVPPMVIRNVGLYSGGQLKYFWPLRNSVNHQVEDTVSHNHATVINPLWSEDLHRNWQLLKTMTVKGNASVAFNQNAEEVYIAAEDSVYQLPINNGTATVIAHLSKNHRLFQGNQSVYNTVENKLYNYYIDNHGIAGYSDSDNTWDRSFDTLANTEYGHTSRVFSGNEDALYIFGGYGQLRFKNEVQRYSFENKKWEELETKGDYFIPRYLAAAGRAGDSIYILGGYGSHSGDQMLKPRHIYDFILFNTRDLTFKKIYTLNEPGAPFVLANSMVIDSVHQCFYALSFDKSRFDTRLQLIKGSLLSPQYKLLGNTIPYSFQDVISDADLFFCPKARQLIAVTVLTELGKETTFKIYSIAFPPNALSNSVVPRTGMSSGWRYLYLLVGLLILGSGYYIYRRSRKHSTHPAPLSLKGNENAGPANPAFNNIVLTEYDDKASVEPPSFISNRATKVHIYLFGIFEIIDEGGKEVSSQFSPLLKELFLIILLYTIKNGKGISSERINDILWGNMTGKNAKNNLSVNMVRLKAMLSKVGNIIIKKTGERWVIEYDPKEVSIDLIDFYQLMTIQSEHGRQRIKHLLYFIDRGAFLKQTEHEWLDEIKADITNKMIDELLREATYLDGETDVEFIVATANNIFHFDPLNEEALRLKCRTLTHIGRHSLAKSAYDRFVKEYVKIYGEDFPVSFNEIANQ